MWMCIISQTSVTEKCLPFMLWSNRHWLNEMFHLPELFLDPEELSLSTLGFFFLWDPDSDAAGRFSTAGVERALFWNSSRSLSRAGSIPAEMKEENMDVVYKYFDAKQISGRLTQQISNDWFAKILFYSSTQPESAFPQKALFQFFGGINNSYSEIIYQVFFLMIFQILLFVVGCIFIQRFCLPGSQDHCHS